MQIEMQMVHLLEELRLGSDRAEAALHRLEHRMADLTQAVADLTVAVQGVSDRVGPKVVELQAQLDTAKTALADLQVTDAADKAATQAALDAASAAADAIAVDTTALNEIAASPPAPVDPPPAV